MTYRFEFTPEAASWREAARFAGEVARGRRARPPWRALAVFQAVAAGLAGLGAGALGWLFAVSLRWHQPAIAYSADLAIFAFIGALVWTTRRHARWHLRRFFERIHGPAVAEFDETGITYVRDGYRAELPWHLFDASHQGRFGVAVMVAGMPVALPNGVFGDAEARAAFLAQVETWAGEARR